MYSVVDELHPDSYKVLLELYNSKRVMGTESVDPVLLDRTVKISPEQGQLMRVICQKFKVKHALEIGFAYGFSTVWLLDALRESPDGTHTAIDPFEKIIWGGVGLASIDKLGYEKCFDWVDDYSIHALSDMIKKRRIFDFIFIDGNHRYDDVMIDFYLCDYLLDVGGIIAFDDMWLPSIRKAVDFIRTNRAYEEIPTTCSNIAVLRKIDLDRRNWDHFIPF